MEEQRLYDEIWDSWLDMKVYGPASRWLRRLIEDLLELIDKTSVKDILDVGCGEGTNTLLLSRQFPKAKIIGTDFSVTAINAAKKRCISPNLSFVHDEKTRVFDSGFDMVTSFEVLEHVEDWQALLQRMSDASRRYILLSFPTGKMRPFEKNVGHFRNFRRGEVEDFLAQIGF